MRSRSNCLFPLLHFIFLSCNFFFVLTFFTLMLLMNIMVNSEKLGVRILSSTIIQKDTCTPIFIEALFTIAWTWTWKQPKCPSTKEWIKKMCVWRYIYIYTLQFSSVVQLVTCVRLFATPWTAARQASLSITNSQSLLKLMSIESVMPSSHLILSCPLLLLPSIFPSISIFSNESISLHKVAKVLEFQLQN